MIYSDCEGRTLERGGVSASVTEDLEFQTSLTIDSVIFQSVQMIQVDTAG